MNFDNLNAVFADFQNLVTHYSQLSELCSKQGNDIRIKDKEIANLKSKLNERIRTKLDEESDRSSP